MRARRYVVGDGHEWLARIHAPGLASLTRDITRALRFAASDDAERVAKSIDLGVYRIDPQGTAWVRL